MAEEIAWADCSCCWPQKPKVRKAIGWYVVDPDEPIDPFWYLEIGGWPKGNFETWEQAMKAAGRYLKSER